MSKDSENLNESCPCKRTKCEKYGNCFVCREHHKTQKNSPPYCERLKLKKKRKEIKDKRKKLKQN